MADGQLHLDQWLASLGFDDPTARLKAVEALRHAGVVSGRPRTFISGAKRAQAEAALEARFVVHCADPDCGRFANRRAEGCGLTTLRTAARNACQVCRGSNTRRALECAREACLRAGVTRWLIVGGSPNLRQDLRQYLEGAPELDVTVDEGSSNDARAVRARGARAQAIAILTTSQINHKDTAVYTNEFKEKVILVPARGLEALFEEMERRAGGRR